MTRSSSSALVFFFVDRPCVSIFVNCPVCLFLPADLPIDMCTHLFTPLAMRFLRIFRSIMSAITTDWSSSELCPIDGDFFRQQEKQQLQNACRNFLINTKYHTFADGDDEDDDDGDRSDDEGSIRLFLKSKVQLFQLFIRTQPMNIRCFR